MCLALLVVSLSLLQGCIAPAVTANLTSPSLDTNISLVSSNLRADPCNDLHNCRTLFSIITSCLTTIFACVWVSVHPNVPGPRQSWTSKQFESFKIVVLMLLVPEWVLAWSIRQRYQVLHYTGILETWTRTHTALIGMGGFHFYRGGQPMFPLDYDNVLKLVKSCSLVPLALDELQDKSKGDAFSMAIALLQTIWFVSQCIGCLAQQLAMTSLEGMMLAYCLITMAMYIASWQKPINVCCPIRVKGENEQ
ncbi:hypothetical protein FIBSPDRAFT_744422, partial [Athelia psychrophila]